MQFNPNRLQAPSVAGNNQAPHLAMLINRQLSDIGGLAEKRGQDIRTSNVAKLIGSGKLSGMSEDEARATIANVSQGDVGKQMSTNIESLLGGKRTAETADELAMTNLGLQKQRDFSAKDRIAETARWKDTAVPSSDGRYASAGGGIVYDTTTGKIITGTDSGTKMDKLFGKTASKQFSEPGFTKEKIGSVESLFDENNLFFDAKVGKKKDRDVIGQIMFEATDNPVGRKVIASSDKEATFEYVRQVLESRGQYLDEGLFGSMEIKDRKDDSNFIDDIKSNVSNLFN